jgi:simple sugar transport system permease protein
MASGTKTVIEAQDQICLNLRPSAVRFFAFFALFCGCSWISGSGMSRSLSLPILFICCLLSAICYSVGLAGEAALHELARPPMNESFRYVLRLSVFTVLIFVTFCFLNAGAFLSGANMSSMAYQLPQFALLALAIHPTMLTGGIDLSVVSVANLAAIAAAFTMKAGPPWFIGLAILVALLLGCVTGAINGLLVAGARLPAILATLGTLQFFAGTSILWTHGSSITGLPPVYSAFGNGTFFGVPIPLIVFLIALAAIYLITARTPLGKQMRLYGTNPRAAVFAGIPTFRVLVITYMISGITAAVGGLVILSAANSANADYGTSFLLLSVLINILAGVNPNGGSGTVFGLILAVLSLQFLSSGLNLLAVNTFAKDLLYGMLLVTVMVVNRLQGRIHSTRAKG